MAGVPVPENSFLLRCEYFGVRDGRKVWRQDKRYLTWDAMHGEVEVFSKLGHHLGSLDSVTGRFLKGPVRGRRLVV